MGARQRAQKRGKNSNKAPKGSLKGSPISQRKGNSSLYVSDLNPASRSDALLGWQSFANSSSPTAKNGFSMSQEARNTERHVLGWGNTKLREQGISFVSAGKMNQIPEQESSTQEEAEDTPGASESQDVMVEEDSEPPSQDNNPDIKKADDEQENIADLRQTANPVDGTSPVNRAVNTNQINEFRTMRDRSVSSSSSETEQIVFRGRQQASGPPSMPASRPKSPEKLESTPLPSTNPPIQDNIPIATQPISITRPSRLDQHALDSSLSDRRITNPRLRRRGRPGRKQLIDEEEAIMQDYIANMAMDDDDTEEEEEYKTSLPIRKNEHFRMYDGAGEENVKVKLQPAVPTTTRAMPDLGDLIQAMDWDSGDLEDFDDFSTTDEEITEIEQVLRQRERPSGMQYLVTGKSGDIGDAKWMLHKKLVSQSALREIRIFEEIQAMEFEEGSFDDDDDSNTSTDDEAEEALNDLIDHIESEDEENTRIMEHTSRMTDEQIARALAKQEELGLGSDQLMLFNGDVGDDHDEMDAFGQGDDFISFSVKQHTSNRGRSKRNNRQRDSFPSASAFADALDEDPYGAFDVMDFDRPSLRPKKKGRKSDYPFDLELEDDDLKDQLVSTWMKDREKKATRKRERQEARMTSAIDASERNDPAVIKAEIKRFLMQEIEVLKLAPMESHLRASIHRLAKAFKLNSHSEGKEGKGAGRFPVLTKTARTPSYTIDTIWEIDALLNTRKFFPKHAGSYKAMKVPRAATIRTRRSGGVQGASYMNGEVVGASAPELGADNKGRLLLEKMGWSTGMGIGKEGNKGSLEAIKHVVKTTKAGLG